MRLSLIACFCALCSTSVALAQAPPALSPAEADLKLPSVIRQTSFDAECNAAGSLNSTGCTAACDDCGANCCCGCISCECPEQPAPCLPCPRVNNDNPSWNLVLGGVLELDMLFSSARPVAPGVPFFLAPGSEFGFNQ